MKKLDLKFAIVATEKWSSREKKHADAEKLMTKSKSINSVTFDTIHIDGSKLDPEIYIDSKGTHRITEKWFEATISSLVKTKAYDGVLFSFTDAEGKKWTISSGLKGTSYNDGDGFMEGWIKADENDVSTYKTTPRKRDKYTKVICHEIGHFLKQEGYTKLNIHDYDYSLEPEINKLEQFYIDFVIDESLELNRKLSLSQRAADLMKILFGLKKKAPEQEELEKFPEELRPLVRQKQQQLIEACRVIGMPIKVTSEVRTCAQQNALYAKGRTEPGNIVTNAKCGQSFHNYGVAFDVAFEGLKPYDGNWELLGMLGEQLGFEWGGRWTSIVDKPHFELTFGYSLSDFQNNKVDWTRYNI